MAFDRAVRGSFRGGGVLGERRVSNALEANPGRLFDLDWDFGAFCSCGDGLHRRGLLAARASFAPGEIAAERTVSAEPVCVARGDLCRAAGMAQQMAIGGRARARRLAGGPC